MNVASYIEHTNLSPTLTISDIDKLVEEASLFGFLGICVPPFWSSEHEERSTTKILSW
jgi:deoxyribose-phosphate aldolase